MARVLFSVGYKWWKNSHFETASQLVRSLFFSRTWTSTIVPSFSTEINVFLYMPLCIWPLWGSAAAALSYSLYCALSTFTFGRAVCSGASHLVALPAQHSTASRYHFPEQTKKENGQKYCKFSAYVFADGLIDIQHSNFISSQNPARNCFRKLTFFYKTISLAIEPPNSWKMQWNLPNSISFELFIQKLAKQPASWRNIIMILHDPSAQKWPNYYGAIATDCRSVRKTGKPP